MVFVFLAVSCGKLRHNDSWPAKITFEGFSEEQQRELTVYAIDLNTRSGETLITTDPSSDGFPITVRPGNPPSSEAKRAGYSILSENECRIEISNFILAANRADYRESVLIHEIGHCAGLDHNPTQGSVMYPTTAKWATYTGEQLQVFLISLQKAVTK